MDFRQRIASLKNVAARKRLRGKAWRLRAFRSAQCALRSVKLVRLACGFAEKPAGEYTMLKGAATGDCAGRDSMRPGCPMGAVARENIS